MTQHGDARRKEKARRNRMQRNGTIVGPDGQALNRKQLPPVQVMLAQQTEAIGIVAGLLETLCRIGLGQSAEDIEKAQGITFPIGPSKEELMEALQAEMDRLAEDEGDPVTDEVPGEGIGFIETDDVVSSEEAESEAIDPYANVGAEAAAILAEAALDDENEPELGGEG